MSNYSQCFCTCSHWQLEEVKSTMNLTPSLLHSALQHLVETLAKRVSLKSFKKNLSSFHLYLQLRNVSLHNYVFVQSRVYWEAVCSAHKSSGLRSCMYLFLDLTSLCGCYRCKYTCVHVYYKEWGPLRSPTPCL